MKLGKWTLGPDMLTYAHVFKRRIKYASGDSENLHSGVNQVKGNIAHTLVI